MSMNPLPKSDWGEKEEGCSMEITSEVTKIKKVSQIILGERDISIRDQTFRVRRRGGGGTGEKAIKM